MLQLQQLRGAKGRPHEPREGTTGAANVVVDRRSEYASMLEQLLKDTPDRVLVDFPNGSAAELIRKESLDCWGHRIQVM